MRVTFDPAKDELNRAKHGVSLALADVGAPSLYLDLVGAEHLSSKVIDDLGRFAWDNATVKVDWNLDQPIPWKSEAARRAGTLHLADSVDALTKSTAELARGLVPETPFLIMGQQSMTDPTRMPPGKETVWAYSHVPREIRGDAAGELDVGEGIWTDDLRERYADRIQARIACPKQQRAKAVLDKSELT